jgi:antibiotic biosynthesis monooxygenase (ABM) superfamily enzyme
MHTISRRTLMRTGGLAVSAVSLAAAGRPETAAAEDMQENCFHAFAFQWKPDVSESQKERAAREIAALQGQIPGLLETHVGPNISPRGKGYTFGGIMRFKDQASLDAYPQQPAHQALLVWLKPLIDAIELDLRA